MLFLGNVKHCCSLENAQKGRMFNYKNSCVQTSSRVALLSINKLKNYTSTLLIDIL